MKIADDSALKDYEISLGQLMVNLHSLEYILRLFLNDVDKERYGTSARKVGAEKIIVGGMVAENYFTNYDSLGELINKYNNVVKHLGKTELIIDDRSVLLRDALAHGRVIYQRPEPPPRLYKFGKPTKSGVPVIDVVDFSEAWLIAARGCTHSAFMKVKQACDAFCSTTIE